MAEPFCQLTKEQLLILLHSVSTLQETFEGKMLLFSERERQDFYSAKNKIHAVLEAGTEKEGSLFPSEKGGPQ